MVVPWHVVLGVFEEPGFVLLKGGEVIEGVDPVEIAGVDQAHEQIPDVGAMLSDGDQAPDWIISGDDTVYFRAERSGTGDGRIYTITVTCTDGCGNSINGTATVTVQHNE